MYTLLLFFYCFLWSFFGVLPPGIINVNATKITVEQGRRRGFIFTLGACLVIAAQASLAVLLTEFLNLTEAELNSIKTIGVGIFFFLAIYFFISAKTKSKPKDIEVNSKTSVFFKGMLFSALNVFPIPYYSFVCTTLTTSNNFSFSTLDVIIFITTIVLGSFLAITCYIVWFKRSKSKENFGRNANYALSGLAFVLAIFALFKLFIL